MTRRHEFLSAVANGLLAILLVLAIPLGLVVIGLLPVWLVKAVVALVERF